VHVHDDALRKALAQVEVETGFTLGDVELTLTGTCSSCAPPS
jgi:Fe2+ or Zn2+ uptake regulation protein